MILIRWPIHDRVSQSCDQGRMLTIAIAAFQFDEDLVSLAQEKAEHPRLVLFVILVSIANQPPSSFDVGFQFLLKRFCGCMTAGPVRESDMRQLVMQVRSDS